MQLHSGIIAASFFPQSLSPVLWLQADNGLYQNTALTTPAALDGDPVGGWQDQSGNANHATQATGGARPALKLSIQNSKPVVRFNGSSSVMASPDFTGADITEFWVFNKTGGNTGYRGLASYKSRFGLYSNMNATNQLGTSDAADQSSGVAVTSTFIILTLIRRAGYNVRFRVNGVEQTAGAAANYSGYTADRIGGDGFSQFHTGDVAERLTCNRIVPNADILNMEAWLAAKYAISVTATPVDSTHIFVACDGNSLTFGHQSSDPATKSYPPVMAAALGSGYVVTNYGVSAQTTVQMKRYAATHSVVDVTNYARSVSVSQELINSIFFGASAATAYADYVTFLQQQRTVGFNKIIACTAFADGAHSGAQNTARQTANASLRADPSNYDALVDLDADPRLSDPNDLTYFNADHEHLNDAGYAVMAELIRPVVAALTF